MRQKISVARWNHATNSDERTAQRGTWCASGWRKRGCIGLFQPGLPGEVSPSLSIRFMGINQRGAAQYLMALYCSVAVLTEDALGVLEGVEVDRYHEYGP